MQHSWFHGIQQGRSLAHSAPSCQTVLSGVDANDHCFLTGSPVGGFSGQYHFLPCVLRESPYSFAIHVGGCNTFLQNNSPCWSVIQWTLSNYFSMNSLISRKLLQKQTFRSVTRTLILERYVTLEFFRTPSFFNDENARNKFSSTTVVLGRSRNLRDKNICVLDTTRGKLENMFWLNRLFKSAWGEMPQGVKNVP